MPESPELRRDLLFKARALLQQSDEIIQQADADYDATFQYIDGAIKEALEAVRYESEDRYEIAKNAAKFDYIRGLSGAEQVRILEYDRAEKLRRQAEAIVHRSSEL